MYKMSRVRQMGKAMLIGIPVGGIYWLLEALVHTYLLKQGTLIAEILWPSVHEVWMRISVIIALVLYIHSWDLYSKLKRTEKALRQSERRFRTVADFAYDWEYWQGPDGRFIYVSPSCKQITGYSPEEFYCNPDLLVNIIHPDDRKRWKTHTHKMLENGDMEPVEFRIITKDGEERLIHHVCRTVSGEEGENLGIRGGNRDISGQIRGILQICASCKRIRDEKGEWVQIESYISDHSEAEFSHGLCPECRARIYPDLSEPVPNQMKDEERVE